MEAEPRELEFRDYEVGFVGASEAVGLAVNNIILQHQAEVLATGAVKQLSFAYLIKTYKAGFFGFIYFRTTPEKIESLNRALFSHSEILRFIIITPPLKRAAERSRLGAAVTPPTEIRPLPAGVRREGEAGQSGSGRTAPPILSNELLEQKLEEILQ